MTVAMTRPTVAMTLSLSLVCDCGDDKPDCGASGSGPWRLGLWAGGSLLRIAYLSSDFGDHTTGHNVAGLFKAHSRHRVKVCSLDLTSGLGLGLT